MGAQMTREHVIVGDKEAVHQESRTAPDLIVVCI
jgi:hypothetical protein